MNAYWIETQEECSWTEEICPEIGGPTYWDIFCGLVFAATRGQARAIFCRVYKLEFTEPLRVHLVASNVNRKCGIADGDDVLFIYVKPAENVGRTPEQFSVFADHVRSLRDYPAHEATS